jgi:hypothetical protein
LVAEIHAYAYRLVAEERSLREFPKVLGKQLRTEVSDHSSPICRLLV